MKKLYFYNIISAPVSLMFYAFGIFEGYTPVMSMIFAYVLFTVGSTACSWKECVVFTCSIWKQNTALEKFTQKQIAYFYLFVISFSLLFAFAIIEGLTYAVLYFTDISSVVAHGAMMFIVLAFFSFKSMKTFNEYVKYFPDFEASK